MALMHEEDDDYIYIDGVDYEYNEPDYYDKRDAREESDRRQCLTQLLREQESIEIIAKCILLLCELEKQLRMFTSDLRSIQQRRQANEAEIYKHKEIIKNMYEQIDNAVNDVSETREDRGGGGGGNKHHEAYSAFFDKVFVLTRQLKETEEHITKPALSVNERKMSQVIGAQDIDINCPIHGLPLVLQEKKTAESGSIIDYYYLKCPNIGCGQTRKLKDAAQLASFLQRNTGEGIIS